MRQQDLIAFGVILIGALGGTAPLAGQGPTASGSGSGPIPVTVQDLIRLRRFEPGIALSPDGTHVAYLLREPNLAKNVNEYVLYVLRLPAVGSAAGEARELLRTRGFGHEFEQVEFEWLATSQGLLVLHQPNGEPRPILSRVELATGRPTVAYRGDLYVTAFAANATGDRLIVAGTVPASESAERFRSQRGVLMTPQDRLADPRREAETMRRFAPEWEGTEEVRVLEPDRRSGTLARFPARGPARRVTMAPDGRAVTFEATAADAGLTVPAAWRHGTTEEPTVAVLVTVPATLPEPSSPRGASGERVTWPTRLAFAAPGARVVQWSGDGKTLLVQGPSPDQAGERVEGLDRVEAILTARKAASQLWAVDVASGAVAHVLGAYDDVPGEMNSLRKVVAFARDGARVSVWYPSGALLTLTRPAGRDRTATWTEERRTTTTRMVSRQSADQTTTNERVLIGVEQTPTVPPDLYMHDLATGQKTRLTEINPELTEQRLGKTELVEWSDEAGQYFGHIVYPVDYTPGTRYPCAILAKGWDKQTFIYESQDGYRAGNFPAQALAGQNILVFMLGYWRANGSEFWDVPGRSMSHRSFHGAREQLAARGLIDPARCGLMGFSSTAFEVAFLVTHPGEGPPWAAAVDADGGLGNYATTMILRAGDVRSTFQHVAIVSDEIHEPTVDADLARFLARSPAWNAQAVRTPVLQQYHGSAPLGGAELYSALYARGKPVELWWFVDGAHTLVLPSERESAMQQILDWFGFWLQGAERPAVPDDPDRYTRWRRLRAQHQQNERWIAEGKDPAIEFKKQLSSVP